MKSVREKKRLVLAGAILAGLAGGGAAVAAARTANGTNPPTTGPMAFVSTTASTATPLSPAAAVDQAMAMMGNGDVGSVTVGSPPSDAPPLAGNPVVPALYVTVKVPSLENGEPVEPFWQADLVEGAVIELAGTSPSLEEDVGDVYFSAELPDGRLEQNVSAGMGDIARGQQFAGANDSDAAIRSSIDDVVARYGLTLDSLKIFRVLGAAPAVVVTTSDVSTLAASYQSLVADLFGDPPRYQGFYLEIRGPDGKTYVRRSVSYVTGAGRLWVDPSVDGAGQLPQH